LCRDQRKKQFFFEKKNQKTFTRWRTFHYAAFGWCGTGGLKPTLRPLLRRQPIAENLILSVGNFFNRPARRLSIVGN
jgi:hypothetical protein